MFKEGLSKIKRVRQMMLPIPQDETACRANGGWIWKIGDNFYSYIVSYPPSEQEDEDTRAMMQPFCEVITGDVPRKYRSKVCISSSAGDHKSLYRWPYLPFYTWKRSRSSSHVPAEYINKCLPCEPDGGPIYYHVSRDNVSKASYGPDGSLLSLPPRELNHVNSFGSYDQLSPTGFLSDTLDRAEDQNLSLLVSRGLSALESALSNLPDLLVIFGELRELGDLLQAPTNLGSAYLYNTFGLQPTIGAVRDVVAGALHRYNDVTGVKSFNKSISVGGDTVVEQGSIPTRRDCCWGSDDLCKGGYANRTITTDKLKYTLECSWRYEPPQWGLDIVNKLDQALTRLNALGDMSTVWELTKLSWLVDWFVPIGTMLKSLSLYAGIGRFQGIRLLDSYVSVTRERNRRHEAKNRLCSQGETVIDDRDEIYIRVPFTDPYGWLLYAADTNDAPLSYSQQLTIGILSSRTR